MGPPQPWFGMDTGGLPTEFLLKGLENHAKPKEMKVDGYLLMQWNRTVCITDYCMLFWILK